jgi:predicted XRE-type DNA-binding protein
MSEKPLVWLGDARDRIRAFPDDVRAIAGFQLWRLQRGLAPNDGKPMPSVGAGVQEIRIHTACAGRDRWVVTKPMKVTRSSGDVFRDLGFSGEEAEYLRVRAGLMLNLQRAITAREVTQAQAAKLLGVTQPRVSDVMRGRIDRFSIDTLIDMLARLGIRVTLTLRPRPRVGAA